MKNCFYILLFMCCCTPALAQYAPQAGVPGSTAIAASSSIFTGWATQCTINRGYLNIDSPALGPVTVGDSSMAIGAVDRYIVSLGDSGVATVSFASALYNGAGADFAVFENGFVNPANDSQAFLELAFVEVSSDGNRYVRFPANSQIQINTQIAGSGVYSYANELNNLAGKYIGNYGTPFDLQELADSPGLDITNITHVRLVDVVGSIFGHSSTDVMGRVINDPYPTQFPTGGFDLDAVGAIHQKEVSHVGISMPGSAVMVSTYPNPATDKITIAISGAVQSGLTISLSAITGSVLHRQELASNTNEIHIAHLPAGMYYLTLHDSNGNKWVERVTKY